MRARRGGEAARHTEKKASGADAPSHVTRQPLRLHLLHTRDCSAKEKVPVPCRVRVCPAKSAAPPLYNPVFAAAFPTHGSESRRSRERTENGSTGSPSNPIPRASDKKRESERDSESRCHPVRAGGGCCVGWVLLATSQLVRCQSRPTRISYKVFVRAHAPLPVYLPFGNKFYL